MSGSEILHQGKYQLDGSSGEGLNIVFLCETCNCSNFEAGFTKTDICMNRGLFRCGGCECPQGV